jgi:hypothetical protein
VNEDEIISEDPGSQLSFSADTITFDTVFTSIGSVTKRFIVRNQNPNALIIENIYVGEGNDSPYSIAVSGYESNSVENQQILGNDSLLVLVTVRIDPSEESLPFVVRDSIVFITNGNVQDVKLQSWGQNAHFLGNAVLDCDTQWSPDLPYFLFSEMKGWKLNMKTFQDSGAGSFFSKVVLIIIFNIRIFEMYNMV